MKYEAVIFGPISHTQTIAASAMEAVFQSVSILQYHGLNDLIGRTVRQPGEQLTDNQITCSPPYPIEFDTHDPYGDPITDGNVTDLRILWTSRDDIGWAPIGYVRPIPDDPEATVTQQEATAQKEGTPMLAQCLNGHSFQIDEGSELELKAIKRIEMGFLDAICVQCKDCPYCEEERRIENRRMVEFDIE